MTTHYKLADLGPSAIGDALAEKVRVAMAGERASVEAACMRLVVALGVDAFRCRAEVRTKCSGDDLEAAPLVGRTHEIVIDGAVVVWRGGWVADGPMRSRWETRWLIDPERLVRMPP